MQEGVVNGRSVFIWDGFVHDFDSWNQDQDLNQAFSNSCVWCYQDIANAVGVGAYKEYLNEIDYGEIEEDFELSKFWLDGSLKISAAEQIDFLKSVYRREYSFDDGAYEFLESMMILEQSDSFTLRGKTGWTGEIGWFVGYVEKSSDIWFFAVNLEVNEKSRLNIRKSIVYDALRDKRII